MFGRSEKQASPGQPALGLADLAADGALSLPPDRPSEPLFDAVPPQDISGVYLAAGIELPGLREQRGVDNGVVVWRLPATDPYNAADLWSRLRALHPQTGLWPVLATTEFWERFGDEQVDASPDPEDGRRWLERRLLGEDGASALADEIPRRSDAPWTPEVDLDWQDMLAASDDAPQDIVLVPAAASWQVPHALAWDGAVNSNILGHDHTAVLRRWSANYGAELVLLGSDVMALAVARPPRNRDSALLVAAEVVTYCPDSVFQGAGSLDALASTLSAPAWFFWWD